MKMLTIAAGLMFVLTSFANAGTVKLGWNPLTGVDGVYVYVDNTKVTPTFKSMSSAVLPVVNGAHSFYVTSYNAWGESPPSNTVTTPPLAISPATLKITITATGLVIP